MSCNEAKTLSHGQYHAVVGEESVTLRIGSNPKDSQTVLVIPNTHDGEWSHVNLPRSIRQSPCCEIRSG